ncbi:MAG: hypothetical protein P8K08_19175 [Fuerstiella sp.]|nr:hypothetical protein [Fuerstiella sp.]
MYGIHFTIFFSAEGQSDKSETDRGRWEMGKFVFPRSSRIRSFFAVTVRHDDNQRLLVGQSILRSHSLRGNSYTPDGWFGLKAGRTDIQQPAEFDRFLKRPVKQHQLLLIE